MDEEEVPATPSDAETALATMLGADGLAAIDSALKDHIQERWLKVARVVGEALDAGRSSIHSEALFDLHVRRLIGLIEAGVLEVKSNPRFPRWSEVRLVSDE